MIRRPIHRLLLAFAASFLIVGIPFWLIPYSEVNLPDAMVTPALLAVVVLAMVLRVRGPASFWKSVLFTGGALPGAVFVRVAAEVITDPTSHNLWPFEIIFAAAVGIPCAAAGALLGMLIRRPGG